MSDNPGQSVAPPTLAEARWRAIIDSAVDAIVVISARGLIESFNPAAERMFGYTEQELLGRNVNVLMPSPYREEHDGYISRHLRTGEQKIIGIGREVTGLRRDGTTFPVHLAVNEMQVGGERHFTGILHDLTSRVALEARLREQTALARLGEMAAVIAHEVKNPLTAVRGAIQVIGGRLPSDNRDAPIVTEIIARLDALNGLLSDLLLFARPPQPKFGTVEMAPILRLVGDLLTKDPAFAAVHIDVYGSAPAVLGDADLLKFVFQNIFMNAAQAMEGRGAIHASVIAQADGGVEVQVRDEGPGVAAEIRGRLFQPFQTTKARGTGLGLSTSKRLIEAHGGTIAIDCPPSGGTVVTVRLPAHAGLETPNRATLEPANPRTS